MRDIAIKKICDKLENIFNISLGDKVALDFFAREGDWQTQYYANKVKEIHAWEIDSRHEEKLRENLPANAIITIGDSYMLAKEASGLFDIVVLDNPQGCYGNDNMYCEHFEALEASLGLLKNSGGLLIFNVKTKPFDYEDKLQWQHRRNSFYLLDDCSYLSEEFVFEFYEDYFSKRGYETTFAFMETRPQESGLEALTVQITKDGDDN